MTIKTKLFYSPIDATDHKHLMGQLNTWLSSMMTNNQNVKLEKDNNCSVRYLAQIVECGENIATLTLTDYRFNIQCFKVKNNNSEQICLKVSYKSGLIRELAVAARHYSKMKKFENIRNAAYRASSMDSQKFIA